MNTAVLLFSACMAGADPVPPPPPTAPAPVYVYANSNSNSKDCCGKANVCGDSCEKKEKCCLIQKIKDKLCCWKKCCEKSNDCCSKNDCGNKNNACNACQQQPQVVYVVKQDPCAKNDCGKGDCGKKSCLSCNLCNKNKDCGKDLCGKAEVSKCDDSDKCCWKPGYFLHKCKEKLCGCCEKKDDTCHGGCGTAATPNGCGSTVIVPATPAAPVAPKTPDVKKIPEKVGSNYGTIRPSLTAGGEPKTIDLMPIRY